MIAKLEGPVFGPYRCSNCKMTQPNKNLKSNCIFCGNLFTNMPEILTKEYEQKLKDDIGDNGEITNRLHR